MTGIEAWIATGNIVSAIGVPVVGGLIGWLHHRNAKRWQSIFSKIKKAKRLAKLANMEHIGFAARLGHIETQLSEWKSPIRNQEN